MEHIKIAGGRKAEKKVFTEGQNRDLSEGSNTIIFDQEFGVKLTLDNSLARFANDPFIVEQTKIANRKFTKGKP